MRKTKIEQLREIVREKKLVRAGDLDSYGIPRYCLASLVTSGEIERISRGVYAVVDSDASSNRTLAEAALRVPRGTVCLLSALRFHNFTTQIPSRVWLAIDANSWSPQESDIPLRIVRFSGEALTAGVEEHVIEQVPVKIYSAAKTVADCFKFRNKIGLDVALEALRESLQERKCTVDAIWKYAKICRISNVIRPYLEATV
ncbi:MAG: type IV toxin-antitoxin system AbiEi family antitoxin domain-containing protein [Candidatus Sabulitectum sp.]|nr:type IV toxin-antitoxin system AbiEi family antitoxin domain-containing protein [Candidatus Sabulitectum sp.]